MIGTGSPSGPAGAAAVTPVACCDSCADGPADDLAGAAMAGGVTGDSETGAAISVEMGSFDAGMWSRAGVITSLKWQALWLPWHSRKLVGSWSLWGQWQQHRRKRSDDTVCKVIHMLQ